MNKAENQRLPIRCLVVEDSKFFRRVVKSALEKQLGAEVVTAESFDAAKKMLAAASIPFDFALVDLILPDSWQGEVVDYVTDRKIPCIVFTGHFSEQFRDKILQKPIIDYILKDSPTCINALISLLQRLIYNKRTKTLIVDDSATSRRHIASLLKSRQFDVLEARDAESALNILTKNPDIRLVITDHVMPKMNGVDMIKKIRTTKSAEELIIIGISSAASSSLSAQFIKYGANDFLAKDFVQEEFFCRIEQNMRMIELVDELRKNATTDFLTGMKNRASFFDQASQLMAGQDRGKIPLTTAMLDIDDFKMINDTYGHEGGDIALKAVADILTASVGAKGVVARVGGEEFAFILSHMNEEKSVDFFNSLLHKIETLHVTHGVKRIPITCSIGFTTSPTNDLNAALALADEMLYRAKKNGRNRVEQNLKAA